ncbi:connector enhancer of kinase suppressor of ras 1 isoform X1 [Leucoraja erinacea]|uniref:connector enhancer of kinase suppressor of ras 1 isoform X1 n=2 Tax=Leucoraja erinaceus TaxID=7782 RepID=UPI0024568C28|nr:connector enhancer of kinase suppressor of ras 1 isoform X1 [Leucoraja erinacea]
MEPINSWSPRRVSLWLQGLDSNVQKYPFDQWQVNGEQLLRLSQQNLEELGVKQIGHQELILEAVELLCALTYDLETENLKILMEKLRAVSGTLQSFIISRRKATPTAQRTSGDLLYSVIDLLQITKAIFSWLNRYPFICIINYNDMKREIIRLCVELAETIHKECSQIEKENCIVSICRELSSFCENMVKGSPEELVNQRACLETIHLLTTSPGQSLGIEIKSNNGLHFITETALNSPAQRSQKIRPGDEVVQVNDMVVVGWTLNNLVAKLRENQSQVVLVMKKLPLDIIPSLCTPENICPAKPQPPQLPGSSLEDATLYPDPSVLCDGYVPDSRRDKVGLQQVPQGDFNTSEINAVCEDESQSMQVDSEPKSESASEAGDADCVLPEPSHTVGEDTQEASQLSEEGTTGERGELVTDGSPISQSPRVTEPHKVEDGMKYHPEYEAMLKSPSTDDARAIQLRNRRKKKGIASKLSRRRISCRDLGLGECYGWLWKKKEHSRFMSQKWKRCWFVLKGHTLYWYNSENDEKAEGLIKLSSYTVEAAGEHKRKFVFQLCHRKFKSFVFSADNVDEMRKWINSIISAVQKYKTEKHYENKEEDCWSETETEECDDSPDVPSASRAKSYLLAQRISDISVTEQLRQSVGDYVQSGQGGVPSSGPSSPSKEKELISEPSQNSNDELEVLMKMLEQGGLSLIGKEQPFRKDYHQSFIRRNKNPIINEKVHNLRALKSTLKAKIVDLQSINKILEDPHLTAAKYRVWKEGNQELLADIQKARQLAKKGRRAKAEHPSIPEQDLQLEAVENSFTWFNTGQISTETSMSVLHELEDNQVTCSGSTSPQSGTGEYDCKEGMHTQQDLDIDRIQRCP